MVQRALAPRQLVQGQPPLVQRQPELVQVPVQVPERQRLAQAQRLGLRLLAQARRRWPVLLLVLHQPPPASSLQQGELQLPP